VAERADGRVPIEELIEFPARYVFKVIGHHTRDFADRAHKVLRESFPDERKIELRTRLSRQGTYLSVTLTAQVESADELKNAYASLRKMKGVITLL